MKLAKKVLGFIDIPKDFMMDDMLNWPIECRMEICKHVHQEYPITQ
jgi:hypothetical protein